MCHDKLVSRIEIGLMTECLYLEQHMQLRGPGGGGGGGLHQNSLEIDFIVVSGRRE